MSMIKRPFSLLQAVLAAMMITAPVMAGSMDGVQGGNVITVTSGSIGATTTLGGTVVPFKEVSFSAQLPGRVVYLAGVEGDWFKAGTVLLALNDDDLLAQQKAALAALNNARANLRNSRVQYTRQVMTGSDGADAMGMGAPKMMDDMFLKPMSSMAGRETPEIQRRAQIYAQGTQIDAARSAITQAQAKLQEVEARLRDTKSIAPFAGVIVRKSVEKGDTVQPGMPLLAFADTRNLQILVDVPARLMPGLQKGMVIPAKLDVGNARIQTRVAQIYPMADAQRHTVTVKLDLPQDAPGGPGMYAEVSVPDITTPIQNLPVVPKSAVVWRGSLPALYVMTAGGEPELRMVRLGSFVDDQTVGVLSGVSVGERIFTSPPANVPDTWKSEQSTKESGKK